MTRSNPVWQGIIGKNSQLFEKNVKKPSYQSGEVIFFLDFVEFQL